MAQGLGQWWFIIDLLELCPNQKQMHFEVFVASGLYCWLDIGHIKSKENIVGALSGIISYAKNVSLMLLPENQGYATLSSFCFSTIAEI